MTPDEREMLLEMPAVQELLREERALFAHVQTQLEQRLAVLVETACLECQKREREAIRKIKRGW